MAKNGKGDSPKGNSPKGGKGPGGKPSQQPGKKSGKGRDNAPFPSPPKN